MFGKLGNLLAGVGGQEVRQMAFNQGAQQLMQPQQPMQAPQVPQGAPPQGATLDMNQAMQAIAAMSQQAKSEDELVTRLSALGEPPTSGQPQVRYPQIMQGGPNTGQLPRIPQTRGESQTNPSLGQLLA
jgi:hypothetical protein